MSALRALGRGLTLEAAALIDGVVQFGESVAELKAVDEELEAISVLLNSHRKKHEQNFKDLCDREASLKAICKLNMAKYKDEAIDALSDVNNYEI